MWNMSWVVHIKLIGLRYQPQQCMQRWACARTTIIARAVDVGTCVLITQLLRTQRWRMDGKQSFSLEAMFLIQVRFPEQ